GAAVDPARLRLGLEVAVRPLDDHLVRPGEPGRGGEDRPRVADGHPVAEEATDLGDGGGEVDGAEHDHAGRRGERLDEHVEALAAALAVDAVVQHRVAARVEQAAGVVAYGVVEALRAGAALGAVRPDHQALAQPLRRPGDDRGDGDRRTGPDGVGDGAELFEARPVDLLDEDVDDPTAG